MPERRGHGVVEHPAPTAFDAGVETRILKTLRLRCDWQGHHGSRGN